MNSPLEIRQFLQPQARPYSHDELALARSIARVRPCRLIDVLGEVGSEPASPQALTARLAATVHLAVVSLADMNAMPPAFDL
ncbi:MAG: hypothetical protein CFE44_26980, partial [Burkholderiales bacterium PBB4]